MLPPFLVSTVEVFMEECCRVMRGYSYSVCVQYWIFSPLLQEDVPPLTSDSDSEESINNDKLRSRSTSRMPASASFLGDNKVPSHFMFLVSMLCWNQILVHFSLHCVFCTTLTFKTCLNNKYKYIAVHIILNVFVCKRGK